MMTLLCKVYFTATKDGGTRGRERYIADGALAEVEEVA